MSPSLDLLSLDLFRTFVCFAQTGRVEDVAKQLGVTQAAVSLQLKRLESEIGQPLYQMVGRRKMLTEFAQSLFQTLAPPLNETQRRLKEASISLNQSSEQILRVVGPDDVLSMFAKKYLVGKKSSLKIFDEASGLSELKDGRCDLAICTSNVVGSGIEAKSVFKLRFKLVIHGGLLAKYKLKLIDVVQKSKLLASMPCAFFNSSSTSADKIAEIVGVQSANQLQISFECENWSLLLQMMLEMPTWSLFPESVVCPLEFEEYYFSENILPAIEYFAVYPTHLMHGKKISSLF